MPIERRLAIAASVALTVVLFVVGGQPDAGRPFVGMYHWLAHLGAYALIGVAYGFAMPRLAWPLVGLLVAALGGIHEYYEITAHDHPLELGDIGINALGGMLGALAKSLFDRLASGRG
jgi:hypothetical protein